ncbi:beta-L-arabinofuranosidase domain-containing protein [Sediminitomix flava]|uniref:DUF1680 family protein n=1 Tax=Sediminitomix flava TaxID=379075 RepID=A0A315ZUU1_SEDFL|nr:beta-L-arabinofuranosidase domain-containing protein [Sediminitomix flava]PWJ39939.1 hypothetical protein BC781_1052 [Sediminitomix flava]
MEQLHFGEIKPKGWILEQMSDDLKEGYVGHLDKLVPDLIVEDDIYGKDRLTKKVKAKDVGAVTDDNGEWEVQFLWWNSETQSNWWDGLIRHAILTEDKEALEKVRKYVENKLATQDPDGYIGVYADDLRYGHTTENGELWAQSSLFRGLLAYYEAYGDEKILDAIEKAVALTMKSYPINNSTPFKVDKPYAGVGHGLTFTDVLDRLYQLTGKKEYLDYAIFLYDDYNKHKMSEVDIQIANLNDKDFRFKGHGVHTYEHLRSLTVAAQHSNDPKYKKALTSYLEKLEYTLTPSGGPIGDEWIFGRTSDSDTTGYEYCSIHELLDSYTVLLQKTGESKWADKIEWLLYNAGQGARHPHEHSIAYCKTDNSRHMLGAIDLKNADLKHHNRYKYSPAHQDVAVCCVPNAGRIYPYFVKSMMMKSYDGITINLYGPSEMETAINGNPISIKQNTIYPFEHKIQFDINSDVENEFAISLRKPSWANDVKVNTDAQIVDHGDYITLSKKWTKGDHFEVEFESSAKVNTDHKGKKYVSYGPLVYSLSLEGVAKEIKDFEEEGFRDLHYNVTSDKHVNYVLPKQSTFTLKNNKVNDERLWTDALFLHTKLVNPKNNTLQEIKLQPMGGTVLRIVSFQEEK